MWTSGKGTWPKNALRASHSIAVESLPMLQSIAMLSNLANASRMMKIDSLSRASR